MAAVLTGGKDEQIGEKRHVTMLFCDLCDFTSIAETCEPEEVAELWRSVEALALRTISAFGGSTSQCYGDGILAVFGLPESAEDDARRAVDAALDLRRLTHEHGAELSMPAGFELRMHFGIHSGVVLVREGDSLHGRYQLTGDAVITTARLCTAAKRDEVLVSADALHSIAPLYETEPVLPLALKGKRESVPAYVVRAPSGIATRFDAQRRLGLTAFQGRDAELELLSSAWREVEASGCRVVRVAGAAGIGKTRLLEELSERFVARQEQVLRGRCDGYGNPPPLQPFSQMFRQLFELRDDGEGAHAAAVVMERLAQLGDELPAHAKTFLRVLGVRAWGAEPETADTKRAILDALACLFRHLRARRPVVLVIDDWQWSDELSRHALRNVIDSAAHHGMLVLLSTRELPASDDALVQSDHVIELRPFQPEESSRVIRSLVPSLLDVGLSAALHQRSGGNPLFLEELCRTLPADLRAGPEVLEQTGIPHGLHAVIQTRIGQLPADAQHLLQVASVVGHEIDISLLEEVFQHANIADVLEQLLSHDLIRRDDSGSSYRFKHGITREVVYGSVLRTERRALHRAIAHLLEERAAHVARADSYEMLAHHYVGSGDHERAVHYAELAGDKAAFASSLDRARIQYRTALYELDRMPRSVDTKRRWLRVCTKWARVIVYNPMREALGLLERAGSYAAELADLAASADVAQLSAWLCYALGEHAGALEHCRTGLRITEQAAGGKLVGQLLSNMGQSYVAAGRYDEGLEYLDKALHLKQAGAVARRSLPVGFAYALGCKALVHAERGAFGDAERMFDEAIQALRRAGHPVEGSVHGLRAMAQLWQGRYAEAIESCAHAAAVAARVDFRYVIAMAQAMDGYARFMRDRDFAALSAMRRACAWLESTERALFLSCVHAWLAEALQLDGQHGLARDQAARALLRAERMDTLGEATALRVVARERAGDGDADGALLALASGERAAQVRSSRRELALLKLTRAELDAQSGKTASARQLLASVAPDLQAMGMVRALSQLESLRATLAEPAEVAEVLSQWSRA